MAKRFTDTTKWKDVWYQQLPAKYKLFWLYILDECDNAGVWKPNIALAQFQIGEPFEESEIRRVMADRIEFLPSGYWFIRKFIQFQYGELSESSKPHLSVLGILKRHSIEYPKGIYTLKDKDIEKDKEKVKAYGPTHDNYVIIDSTINSPAIRVNGKQGLSEYMEANMSVLNNPNLADKYMLARRGKKFNDFGHLWNDYRLWIENHFK
jgi:hypothetical protein